MHGDAILGRHVEEHAREPVVRLRGEEIGRDAEFGAAERGRYGVAAEAHGIVLRDSLFVAGWEMVGQKRDVDVGLTDEERFHA
jgi:hypothetical protein